MFETQIQVPSYILAIATTAAIFAAYMAFKYYFKAYTNRSFIIIKNYTESGKAMFKSPLVHVIFNEVKFSPSESGGIFYLINDQDASASLQMPHKKLASTKAYFKKNGYVVGSVE